MNPFDFVNAINHTKVNVIEAADNKDLVEKSYNPFVVNRSLSYFIDTVLAANEMNSRQIDNKLQFEFLLNTVRPKRRFAKWAKKREDDLVELVKDYYGYSTKKAIQALSVLTEQQKQAIRTRMNKGGVG
jgi:hypothetical protein